jgi:hypothetical protein
MQGNTVAQSMQCEQGAPMLRMERRMSMKSSFSRDDGPGISTAVDTKLGRR